MATEWLDRRIARPGPCLALCLDEDAFRQTCVECDLEPPPWLPTEQSDAAVHLFWVNGRRTAVVCMRRWDKHEPVEVAGMLVHEAVHVWQDYADGIGEHVPGREQEAYAIQAIAQELMAEFARQIGART